MGKPCTLHPELAPPKAKGVRAATCDAKEIDMRNHQERLKKKLGIKAFYPEPQKGGNSNTGPAAIKFFGAPATYAEILGIPQELILIIWELMVTVNGLKFQDVKQFEEKASKAFYFWCQVFDKPILPIFTSSSRRVPCIYAGPKKMLGYPLGF